MTEEIKNAKITEVMLGFEGHGIFTMWIHIEYGSSGQAFGGYCLGEFNKKKDRQVGSAYGCKYIMCVLNVVGVDSVQKLQGQHIRVRATFDKVSAIGNILKDEWFFPEKLAEEFKKRKEHDTHDRSHAS